MTLGLYDFYLMDKKMEKSGVHSTPKAWSWSGRGAVLSDSKAGFSVASSPDLLCLTATLQDCVMIPIPQM